MKQLSLEVTGKDPVRVRDYRLRQTVQSVNIVQESLRVWMAKRYKMAILSEQINNDQDAVEVTRQGQTLDEI